MSIFSDTLSSLIKEKNIKIFSMVKYCGLDRSTMYKIISGKRNPPSPDIFKQMKDYMRLTPSEEQQLTEAWKIARIGSEKLLPQKKRGEFYLQFSCRPFRLRLTVISGTSWQIMKKTSVFHFLPASMLTIISTV